MTCRAHLLIFLLACCLICQSYGFAANNFRSGVLPFIVRPITEDNRGKKQEFQEISEMCIDVFFNDKSKRDDEFMMPWTALQLAYLRNMQYSDLQMRNFDLNKKTEESEAAKKDRCMFVARRVEYVSSPKNKRSNRLVNENEEIFNKNYLNNDGAKDEVLQTTDTIGFIECSARIVGLGGDKFSKVDWEGRQRKRPFITNVAVRADARRSGVGSKLMSAVEDSILSDWTKGMYEEIALQVEDDNPGALKFYEKLGYEVQFADPTCRRFNTSGIFLSQERSTKITMTKSLFASSSDKNAELTSSSFSLDGIFKSLRKVVLSQ